VVDLNSLVEPVTPTTGNSLLPDELPVSAARPAAAARAKDRIMGFSLCLLTTKLDHR
jgi:hypothetical protein